MKVRVFNLGWMALILVVSLSMPIHTGVQAAFNYVFGTDFYPEPSLCTGGRVRILFRGARQAQTVGLCHRRCISVRVRPLAS